MNIIPFEAKVRSQAGVATIDLHGDINAFAEPDMNAAYTEAEASSTGRILLNFSGVSYMNSIGIALIVGMLSRARKSNREIAAYGLSDHYLEIFQITRLADYMKIFPDEISALQIS
jgi:anti-anti-sigma factor